MTRVLALLLATAALPAEAAQCLIIVRDEVVVDGPCHFDSFGGDGSFEVRSADGWTTAEVLIDRRGVGQGWWDETDGSGRVSAPLGTLYRDDACWTNSFAQVCAW